MWTPYDHINIEAVGHKLQVNNLWLKPIEFDGFKKLDWLNCDLRFNPFEIHRFRKLAGLNMVKVGCRYSKQSRGTAMRDRFGKLSDRGKNAGGQKTDPARTQREFL